MSRGSIFLGVLAGLATGAILGIMFAPDKGSDTRRKIVNKGEDYVDNLKGRINTIIGHDRKNAEKVRETAA
jgi:gas vesicle protein